MIGSPVACACALAVLAWLFVPAQAIAAESAPAARASRSSSAADVARGRYVAILGGCNDCHTAGYAPAEGKIAESQWLKGDPAVGFGGPWGTTYAPNLRAVAASMTEDEWVRFARALKTRPPMPFFTLNQMTVADLRALYRYIRQLGPPGDPVSIFLPPGAQPAGPVIQWPSPPK